LENLCEDGRMILKWIFKKWDVGLKLIYLTQDREKWRALIKTVINPLNPELNPICYLLALLAYHFLHVSRIRVKSLTFRLLMSYIYSAYS
jgi:hypothetical protein